MKAILENREKGSTIEKVNESDETYSDTESMSSCEPLQISNDGKKGGIIKISRESMDESACMTTSRYS